MDETRCTVFFDGRFWTAVVERESAGTLRLARHVFGAEPGNGELRHFYLYILPSLTSLKAPKGYRSPKPERPPAREGPPASLEIYKASVAERTGARAKECRAARDLDAEARFAARQDKRKRKHRGH
jgi:hypothetical protein